MKKRRNWLLVLFGVVVLVVFVGIGAIVAIGAWAQQNVAVHESSVGEARAEFESVLSKFGARPPLLVMRDGRPAYSGGAPPAVPSTPVPVERMHVLVWDDKDSRLVSLSIPFWVLRLKSTPIQFSAYVQGFDDNSVKLRPQEIERYGPGIILDVDRPSGDRVLLWAQ